jgi:hypothetical protein
MLRSADPSASSSSPVAGRSIIGTSHIIHDGDPEDLSAVVGPDVDGFLGEVNDAPQVRLERAIYAMLQWLDSAEDKVQRSRRSLIIDHASVHGVRISVCARYQIYDGTCRRRARYDRDRTIAGRVARSGRFL